MMLQDRVKEYVEVVELLSVGILKPDSHFIFWRNEEAQRFEDLSPHDIQRIHFQLFCCEKVFRRLLEMTKMKWKRVSELLSNLEAQSNYMIDFLIKEYNSWLVQYKESFTIPKIVEDALKEILPVSLRPSSKTLTSWFNEFKKDKYKGWNMSCRGHHTRKDRFDNIAIGDEMIHDRFKRYLATENQLSPMKSRQWLQQLIQERIEPGDRVRDVPISMRWIRKWMKHYGAQYLERKKSYYSDNHESESTLYYRKNTYLPQQNTLSLRQPMWVEIPLNKAISYQRDDSAKRTGLTAEQCVWKRGEELFTKIHIDFLDVDSHSAYRKTCLDKIGDPGRYYYDTDQSGNLIIPETECQYEHGRNCKCYCKILKLGHDEKIWFSESQNRSAWTMTAPKNKGVGVMTSAFVDPYRGMGLPLSAEELERVNTHRRLKGRSNLIKSPGLTFFRYGVHKDGYWNYQCFYDQLVDVLDVIEVIYPTYQLVLEVDQSSGHMKYEDDALITSRLNVGWGGSQPLMRDSRISSQDYLGNQSPAMFQVGEIQKMYFDEQSTGPFYEHDADAIKLDRPYSQMQLAEMQSRSRSNKPLPTTKKGWLHQPKGMKQILWERGLYVNGMNKYQMQQSLAKCSDFQNEKIGIQKLLESRGHILIVSPKCHPEIAGSGIEYCWGMADLIFRKVEGKKKTPRRGS
jgi:hypothetical protein